MLNKLKSLSPLAWAGLTVMVIAICLRLYAITDNQFLFYDEGMYLGQNRALLNLIAHNPAHDLNELMVILGLMSKIALQTPKALWFFLLNLRVFFVGVEAWWFARVISAIAGIATVILTYFWAKRYLKNERIACISALFLAILPSHVFYSRLGMQESLSTLLFLAAIYLYMANRALQWRFFASALVLSCVFFTNYRMVIAPVFIGLIELFTAWQAKRKVNWLNLIIYGLVFYGIVFIVGSLYDGANREVTFGWMFHQAQDAEGKRGVLNFLSFPCYVFLLEGIFFALLFWDNLGALLRRQYQGLLPFTVVVLQMGLFSFAAEKGARYLCVVLPFMAIAAAVSAHALWDMRLGPVAKVGKWLTVLAVGFMLWHAAVLTVAKTNYQQAIQAILQHDPNAGIVSTQPLVEGLYVSSLDQVKPCPKDLAALVALYKQGARYLVIDPQAYISWTANERRFSPPLINFLEAIRQRAQPVQTFPHLNRALLTRFVLDHNEQLADSLGFLSAGGDYGEIKIYDLGLALAALQP